MGSGDTFAGAEGGVYSVAAAERSRGEAMGSPAPAAHAVTLRKDPLYEDFGFSVSDGAFDKGVFVNRVRSGGPAHASGAVQPYDRILQVNGYTTTELDCCP